MSNADYEAGAKAAAREAVLRILGRDYLKAEALLNRMAGHGSTGEQIALCLSVLRALEAADTNGPRAPGNTACYLIEGGLKGSFNQNELYLALHVEGGDESTDEDVQVLKDHGIMSWSYWAPAQKMAGNAWIRYHQLKWCFS